MSYPVGTICIGQKHTYDTYRNDMECEIIGPSCLRHWIWHDTGLPGSGITYYVRWANGIERPAWPHNLRLKRHDDEDKEARSRVKDRQKVSKLISDCLKAIEAGEKV